MKKIFLLVLVSISFGFAFADCNDTVSSLSITTTTSPSNGVVVSWDASPTAGATYDVVAIRLSGTGTVLGTDTTFYVGAVEKFYPVVSASDRYAYEVRINCDSTNHGVWSSQIENPCREQVVGLTIVDVTSPANGKILTWTPVATLNVTYDIQVVRSGYLTTTTYHTNNPSFFFACADFYYGIYTFNVRANYSDGTHCLWSAAMNNVFDCPDCKVELPDACPGMSLNATATVTSSIPEIILGCEVDTFVLRPTFNVNGGQVVDYTVSSIPYNPPYPFTAGNAIFVNSDDIFSPVITLPFPFCFYENTYTRVTVGANGLISFNAVTGYNSWSTPSTNIPTPSLASDLMNAIYGVMEDGDPSRVADQNSHGTIKWALLGDEPCRVLSVSWYNIPMFSCNELWNSYQIVLYEGSNIIDVYVNKRNLCNSWNGGRGVIGVQNINGTKATAAPGRNLTNTWSTVANGVNTPEAWRFTPVVNSTNNYTMTWYKGAQPLTGAIPNSNIIDWGDSLKRTPTQDGLDTITCRLQVLSCNGTSFDFRDRAVIKWERPVKTIYDTICQNNSYNDNGFVVPMDSLRWERTYIPEPRIIQTPGQCDTTLYLNLRVRPNYHTNTSITICPDSVYMLGEQECRTPGFYTDTLTSSSGCDSIVILYLSHFPGVDVLAPSVPSDVCVGDNFFDLQFASSGAAGAVPPTSYKVEFDAAALAQGFVNQEGEMNIGDGYVVRVNLPSTAYYPDLYYCNITFYDSVYQCASATLPVGFVVHYPPTILEQKWNNVIAVRNEFYNGGYSETDFLAYQWYRNDSILSGEVKSYFYLGEGKEFNPNDCYSVEITRLNGSSVLSCPLCVQYHSPSSPYPVISQNGNVVTIHLPAPAKGGSAVAKLWTTTGILLDTRSFAAPEGTMVVPTDGTYLLDVRTSYGANKVFPIVVRR